MAEEFPRFQLGFEFLPQRERFNFSLSIYANSKNARICKDKTDFD